MNKKSYSLFIALLLSFPVVSVYAQISVGLKEGDWVEYTGTYTGNPPETYSDSARIEIKTIQATLITVEFKATLLNGTQTSRTETFDLQTGSPDLIMIPANLGLGDEVYNEYLGTYTIERIENYNFEGTTRELVYANLGDTDFKWDRNTGIVIEIIQTSDTFTGKLTAVNTNMIQTQASELDPMLIYGIVIAVIIIIIILVVLVLKRKK
ncbi:hypothetical protein AC477_03855 [miscellaneous Crenarchaeota group-1 archaeon SG8-32-1]|uniref:Uncharacterized protein n=1 Tax=miscellaneous Crenarchaeota group-1 archaeon SG8-32-1 TaxID=1685124 RepID=A0A0M0BUC2_9ARCH|nr:MAG: hypothetical protein AC477_03855 [miscellaneous Crenarchaeota group-1 archaeon SG8-32-1]